MRLLPIVLIAIGFVLTAYLSPMSTFWAAGATLFGLGLAVGIWDYLQRDHSLFRNYPLVGRIRPLLESIRPQIRQYFIESDTDGMPFDREQRSLVYQRAKRELDSQPFGTELAVREPGYEWLNHSIKPAPRSDVPFRIDIGGDTCLQVYNASIFNISAMSFGSLGEPAVLALNRGAQLGGFAQDTGEGGLTPYHLDNGGDLIWEIGSGYFSCRDEAGHFDHALFAERAVHPSVKMIEIKLSQGAKPGHGGVLPGPKVSAEIAAIRGVEQGVDCVSPASHSAFSTPRELLEFIRELRDLSGGKPVGFKLCVGHPWEILAIGKAMLETGIVPDFVVVDGKEGGTGAAPLEFSDHMGSPLREGLLTVHNVLTAIGVRGRLKIGASGKVISAFDIAICLALGADWCNAARGFMFSLGCLQSQRCHTDRCPVGIATQDKSRQRGLDITDKAMRVQSFHEETTRALSEIVAAVGISHARELQPWHFYRRLDNGVVATFDYVYRLAHPGELIDKSPDAIYADWWALASADQFTPAIGSR